MRRPDLLVLVAVWNFFVAFGLLVAALAIAAVVFPAVAADSAGADQAFVLFGLSIALLIVVVLLLLFLLAGIGVLQGRGWGRMLAMVTAVLSLFALPFGTAAGILILIYLSRPEVQSYFGLNPPAPPAPPPATPV